MAESNFVSPYTKESVTVTKLWTNALDILAEKNVRNVHISGHIQLNASQYTTDMPLFRLSAHPSANVFVIDDKGSIYRLKSNGELIFHENTTVSVDQYRFFNFSYCS